MRIWSAAVSIADAEASAATINDSGRMQLFFRTPGSGYVFNGNGFFGADAIEIDRYGGVVGDPRQTLGFPWNDPSLSPDPEWYYWVDDADVSFQFALTAGDGSTQLFSLNSVATFREDGEPGDYAEPWVRHWQTDTYLTAYRLGAPVPDASGFVPYQSFQFVVQGVASRTEKSQAFEVHYSDDPWDWDYEEYAWGDVTTRTIEAPSAAAFDSNGFLVAYRSDYEKEGDYYTGAPDGTAGQHVTYHDESSGIYVQFADGNGGALLAPMLLDSSPVGNSVVVERPGDALGVLWINDATAASFRLSMSAVDNTGAVIRSYKADIAAAALPGSASLAGLTLLGASAADDGAIIAVIEAGGRPYLARFDSGLHLSGNILAIDGGRWSGRAAEHVTQTKIVHTMDGGYVLALGLEQDGTAGGADHRILVQHYDGDGHKLGSPVKIAADGSWFDLADMGDGRLTLAWADDGKTFSEILDTRTEGVTRAGTDAVDTFIGTAFVDELHGALANDRLVGGAGNDRLYGDAGNDLLIGGDGRDRLEGGEGRDVARYDAASTVDLLDRTLNTGQAKGDFLVSIEQLRGSYQADSFFGSNSADTLEGQGGADVLDGRGGNDLIVGGLGADLVTGGAGDDHFRYDAIEDGGDTITDFVRGDDVLVIRGSAFGISAIALVTSNNPAASENTGTFLFDRDDRLLSFDADGGGASAAVAIAVLEDLTALATSDFVLA